MEASAVHVYEATGTYFVQVEVTDAYGHTAVSDPVQVQVGYVIYLPMVVRDAP